MFVSQLYILIRFQIFFFTIIRLEFIYIFYRNN